VKSIPGLSPLPFKVVKAVIAVEALAQGRTIEHNQHGKKDD
jgi:hypothetical protein